MNSPRLQRPHGGEAFPHALSVLLCGKATFTTTTPWHGTLAVHTACATPSMHTMKGR